MTLQMLETIYSFLVMLFVILTPFGVLALIINYPYKMTPPTETTEKRETDGQENRVRTDDKEPRG